VGKFDSFLFNPTRRHRVQPAALPEGSLPFFSDVTSLINQRAFFRNLPSNSYLKFLKTRLKDGSSQSSPTAAPPIPQFLGQKKGLTPTQLAPYPNWDRKAVVFFILFRPFFMEDNYTRRIHVEAKAVTHPLQYHRPPHLPKEQQKPQTTPPARPTHPRPFWKSPPFPPYLTRDDTGPPTRSLTCEVPEREHPCPPVPLRRGTPYPQTPRQDNPSGRTPICTIEKQVSCSLFRFPPSPKFKRRKKPPLP